MLKKVNKGEYGYINKKRNRVILLTALYFLISAAIFIIGYITTGTKKNLLTVVAVLGCLPACKSFVNMIMYIRAKGCSDADYKKISEAGEGLNIIYDLYFTSYSKNFDISALLIHRDAIICYTRDKNFAAKAFSEHISTMLKQAGHKNKTVTSVTDIDKYIEMLLNLRSDEKTDDKNDGVLNTLFEISL